MIESLASKVIYVLSGHSGYVLSVGSNANGIGCCGVYDYNIWYKFDSTLFQSYTLRMCRHIDDWVVSQDITVCVLHHWNHWNPPLYYENQFTRLYFVGENTLWDLLILNAIKTSPVKHNNNTLLRHIIEFELVLVLQKRQVLSDRYQGNKMICCKKYEYFLLLGI